MKVLIGLVLTLNLISGGEFTGKLIKVEDDIAVFTRKEATIYMNTDELDYEDKTYYFPIKNIESFRESEWKTCCNYMDNLCWYIEEEEEDNE